MNNGKILDLKVCGMREPQNILDIADLRPDFMGFNFYPASSRFVGEDFEIPEEMDDTIRRVGIFVNQEVDDIIILAQRHRLDHVQLHGSGSVNNCEALRTAGLRVIRAFGIDECFKFSKLRAFEPVVDYFLFDTRSVGFGGSGLKFDWTLLRDWKGEVPFVLAGGIGPEEIEELEKLDHPNLAVIDVNSRVEVQPGIKSAKKVGEVLTRLRQQTRS